MWKGENMKKLLQRKRYTRRKKIKEKVPFKVFLKRNRGTIIFYSIIILFIVYGIFSIKEAQNNAIARRVYNYEGVEPNVDTTLLANYKKVADSKHLELYFDEGKGNFQLKNTNTGYVWKSIVDEEVYPISKLNKQWNAYVQSAFTISYNDIEKRDAPPSTLYSSRDCDYIDVTYIDNGVEVKYGFTTVGIFITIQYWLEDGTLKVNIPYEGYEELLQYCVTTVEVLPFFGAAGNEVDGYLFYPDGNGAITRYDMVGDRSSKVKQGILRNYSDKKVTIESYLFTENTERYVASMPVLGIKNNSNALFATVTKGEEEVGINTYPSGIVVDLNRINFDFYTRNVFDVAMFNMSNDMEGNMATGKEIQRVDSKIIQSDREITYFALDGEEANYSGMANLYRNYLVNKGELVKTIEDGSKIPLALELFMGVTEEQMLGDKYIPMTTFDNAIEILERLKERGIEDSKLLLTSWQENGISYPLYWPADNGIGGKKGMKRLDEYLSNHPKVDAYLENNFVFARKENGGFSAVDDIIYSGINLPISSDLGSTWYILNPGVVYDRAMDFVDKIQDFSHLNVAYHKIGKMVYPDFNKDSYYTRQDTVATWQKLLQETTNQNKKVAVDGTNQYVYQNTDYLYNVRLDAYGLAITDEDVPFLSMVLSGMIPMSGKSGNLTYDLDIQKLEWIEYNTLPYFLLTYEDAVKLKESGYNDIFSSTFDKWEDRVVQIYQEFEANFSSLYGKQMTSHEQLSTGIVKIGYEEDTNIYLNYTEELVVIEGISIPAKDYIIISQKGR